MKKNLLKIYDIFKPNEKIKETESFNDINKVTKKILINKKKFKNYFNEYTKKTEVYSFKFPGITHFPLLQKKSCALLPIHKSKLDYYEDLNENKKSIEKKEEPSLLGKNKFIFSASKGDTFYKDKIKQNLRMAKNIFRSKLLNIEKAKLKIQKGQRYNSLFLDFFHKWNKDRDFTFDENSKMDINLNKNKDNDNSISLYSNKSIYENNTVDYKHIINEKYSELKYDDNLIYNSNYTDFVNERLEFILLNDVENIETKLESNFNDLNKNEIKLRLESIKINFKPIRSKISSINNLQKKITLYVPLYFTFLFCLKDIDFFKYILLSCITFSENDKIIFDENLIKPALKAFFTQKKEEKEEPKPVMRNSGAINSMNKKNTTAFRRTATKAGISFRKSSVEKKGTIIGNPNSKIFNLARNSILENNFSMNKKKKKEEIIHSNKKNINYFYSTKENKEKDKDENKINSKKEINQYDEYIFLWETDDKTYLVNIQMPLIFFNFKNLKEEIVTYCDKTLFLYMYKNNFINWDFYTLNYLFSIKVFRKRILQNYSLAKKNILNNILPKGNFKIKNTLEEDILKYMNKTNGKIEENSAGIKNDKFDLNEEISIINEDKNKVYNMVNPNNESYLFFYTNEFYQNTLIKMYSYIIIIDYDKLNPKVRWKYILNFKLMKLLNEISKYEPLETFLPKITKTDFQNGRLSIDFSVFKEFNIGILGYEKINLSNEENYYNNNQRSKIVGTMSNYTKENQELCVDIKFPSFKEEKIVIEDNKMLFKKTSTNIDINFLQELNKFKMDFWSKKILDIINKRKRPFLFSTNNVLINFIDKKENDIKKTTTYNNYENNNDDSNNFNKNYLKSTSFTHSKFANKNQ